MSKLLFFVFLGFGFFFAPAQNFDIEVLHALNRNNKPVWDKAMKALSVSVYPAATSIAGVVFLHGHYSNNQTLKRDAFKSAFAIALAVGISTGTKYIVGRKRPFDSYPNDIVARDHSGTSSFPSGHTTAAFASATTLSLSYKKWYVAAPAFLFAGFVGYARMRLGMHYPTDILGGVITGVGSGFLTWKLEKWIYRKQKSEKITAI